jgi:16S rRNA (cytidine1402-2'-O)-methyltransferase
LAKAYAQAQPRGEITLVVGPAGEPKTDLSRVDAALAKALAFMPVRAAVDLVAEMLGAPRREVYARALARKKDGQDG